MNKIKVLLADDHTIVLEGLRAVLNSNPEIEVVAEVNNGKQVLDFVSSNRVDIAVLDINMPEMDGLSCAKRIKHDHPNTKVIILTMYAQKIFTDEIIKIGVDGCLLKNNTGKELVDAIFRVASGKSYYDLIKTFTSASEEIAQFRLSEREVEIIKLIAEGLSSSEIADKLYVAENTVKTHRKNILRKTGQHSTSQLIQFARNNQLI